MGWRAKQRARDTRIAAQIASGGIAGSDIDWAQMVREEGVREPVAGEHHGVVPMLDYLVQRKPPFTDGKGWTVFNDWLDLVYIRFVDGKDLPGGLTRVSPETIREVVFSVPKKKTG